MNLNVGSDNPDSIQPVVENVETVEVVSGTESVLSPSGTGAGPKMVASSQLSVPSSGMIEIDPHALTCTLVEMASQQLAQQGNSILPSSIAGSVMSVTDSSPLVAGMKRPITSDTHGSEFGNDDIPRKKSRNYLDSHKNIEKKRRDRINTGLTLLKEMVPDCRQYGTKKLDKAEIIEFTIQYIKRMQSQPNGRTGDSGDLAASQRDWANELMTWVFQNKLLYTGPNALEQFCNALLLNLQSIGNPPPTSLSSPSNVLLNQGASGTTSSDDESIIRSHANLLQQLVSSVGQQQSSESSSGKLENTPNQQQIAQIQALLLLQQQQLLGQQQSSSEGGGGTTNGTQPDENQGTQLHQLQQLQALLLQHIASESGQQKSGSNEEEGIGVAYSQCADTGTTNTVSANESLMVGGPSISDAGSITTGVDLSLSSAITSHQGDHLDPAPVYSSTSLDDNLLDSTATVQSSTQMWSGQQDSSILLEDGVQEHSIESEVVQDEVELLSSAGQQDQ